MNWILSHSVVVAFAILGGIASLCGMVIQTRGNARSARLATRLAYLLMGISVLLFIVQGVVGPHA